MPPSLGRRHGARDGIDIITIDLIESAWVLPTTTPTAEVGTAFTWKFETDVKHFPEN